MITLEEAQEMIKTNNKVLIDLAVQHFPELGVSNFEKACKALNRSTAIPEGLSERMVAMHKLETIIEFENGDWQYEYEDDYFIPVFSRNKDNVFSFYYVYYWDSHLYIPAPLYFRSRGICEKVAKENLDLFEILYSK